MFLCSLEYLGVEGENMKIRLNRLTGDDKL